MCAAREGGACQAGGIEEDGFLKHDSDTVGTAAEVGGADLRYEIGWGEVGLSGGDGGKAGMRIADYDIQGGVRDQYLIQEIVFWKTWARGRFRCRRRNRVGHQHHRGGEHQRAGHHSRSQSFHGIFLSRPVRAHPPQI